MPRTATTLPFNLSWKAILAFLFPVIAAAGTAVVLWLTGGTFDAGPILVAVGGVIAGGISLLGAYLGKPAAVVHPDNEQADLHDAIGA